MGIRAKRLAGAAALLAIMVPRPAALAAQGTPADTTRARIIAAAADVMQSARYATLITIGEEGRPQARIVDPFAPESGLTIWIATNALTRKVQEIRADPRVTLLYFNATASEYVTLLGRAELVTDSAARAHHWKEDWTSFYKDRNRGSDYLLIRVRPFRIEISSPRHHLMNDPVTWRPVILDLPGETE